MEAETNKPSEALRGIVERVTFHNADTGFCILRVQVAAQRDLVTVVGKLSRVVAGEFLDAIGAWFVDPQHGPQFKASELRTTQPHSKEGIAKYLSSGLVKGIGPTYAQKITDVFGEQTLDIIDRAPAMLSQIKGIGPKRIERIRQGWQEQKQVHRIMVFLQSFGLGTARAMRIYRSYGEHAIEVVRANPYRLSSDIWGIGFHTADELALQLGLPRDGQARAQAALTHVLQDASTQGHVGLPTEVLLHHAIQLTQIPEPILQQAIQELIRSDELIIDTVVFPKGQQHRQELNQLVYLKALFVAEQGLAKQILSLQQNEHPLPATDYNAAIAWVEQNMGIRFATRQREAVQRSLTEKVLVLTGGPGTGKTTIIRAVFELFQAKQQRIAACAPTGRAAKRLAESTGAAAKTIHRLLEYDVSLGGFRRTRDNPLDIDLLIVDEVSMADVNLAFQLLRAVPPWAAVLFVGDRDQLPSVGPGNVLADLIDSEQVPVVRLDRVHRQAEASWIIRAAHTVNQGEEPVSAPPGGDGDFYFVATDEPEKVVEQIVELVQHRIPDKFKLDPLSDIQVLSPMNKSLLGVANLNQTLQAALNPLAGSAKEIVRYGTSFRVGDKVMQTRNQYQREVFNGDIGRILSIDFVDQVVIVNFDGRAIEYDFADLDELTLAYAVSIHKSQGSEYPAVVIPVHTQHWVMLQRNLIYTGLTRGKKLVVLVGSRKALHKAISTTNTARRFSLLAARLQQVPRDTIVKP